MKLLYKLRSRLQIRPIQFLDIILLYENFFLKKFDIKSGAYLEFGTFNGASAARFYRALQIAFDGNAPLNKFPMYLFDSFEGLPESLDAKDKHSQWSQGEFDGGGVEVFKKKLTKLGVPAEKFQCVPGYYSESLPKFKLPEGMKASIVNVDCDYYTSTVDVLKFLKPYLQNFTLIYFDDLHAFSGNPAKGQLAAIKEFNDANTEVGIVPCPYFQGRYEGRIFYSWVN